MNSSSDAGSRRTILKLALAAPLMATASRAFAAAQQAAADHARNAGRAAPVLNFLHQFNGGDWPDFDKLLASFSQDCVSYVLFPTTKPIVGRDKLKEELMRQAKTTQTPRSDVKACATNGKYVFVERVDSLVTHGIAHTISMNSVFEVNSDNLITAWREYFDSGDVARQLHMSADTMSKLMQG